MTVRRIAVWVVAIVVLSVYVWSALSYTNHVYRVGDSVNLSFCPICELGSGVFYAGALILLEGILAAVRKDGYMANERI